MAQCNKSWSELAAALFVLIFIAMSTGFEVLGTYWNQYGIKEGSTGGNVFIIMGNILSVFASFAAVAILARSSAITTTAGGIIAVLIFLGLVLDLYFTMFAESSNVGDAFTYAVVGFNALPRFIAVLLGYGICSIPDVIEAAKILGGKRRR